MRRWLGALRCCRSIGEWEDEPGGGSPARELGASVTRLGACTRLDVRWQYGPGGGCGPAESGSGRPCVNDAVFPSPDMSGMVAPCQVSATTWTPRACVTWSQEALTSPCPPPRPHRERRESTHKRARGG